VWAAQSRRGADQRGRNRPLRGERLPVLQDVFDATELAACRPPPTAPAARATGIDPGTIIEEPDSKAVRSIFEIHRQHAHLGRPDAGSAPRRRRALPARRRGLHPPVAPELQARFQGRDFWWHSDFETWHIEDGMPRMRALSALMLTDNLVSTGR
jgi:ectoine hydroxylase